MSDWGLHILIIADTVVRERSLLRTCNKKALFMNYSQCFLVSSAALAAMNASLSVYIVDGEHNS
jgi:hypothetical protein